MPSKEVLIPPGYTITVTADVAGTLTRLGDLPGTQTNAGTESLAAAATVVRGPFTTESRWKMPHTWTYAVAAGTPVYEETGPTFDRGIPGFVKYARVRQTIAVVNAGATLLAAPGEGLAYRLVDAWMVAEGGAVGAVTTVDVKGVQATSLVKLVAFAQASLTQSAVLKAGGTGAAVLADGASFGVCDENTALTIDITGSAITTASHIQTYLQYVIEEV